jgi:hypothetical protein
MLVAILLLSAGACAAHNSPDEWETAPVGPAAVQSPRKPSAPTDGGRAADQVALAEFAGKIGVECNVTGQKLTCIGGKPENGDYYDVALHPGCGSSGKFGAVIADASELRDKIAPLDEKTNAILARGQLVCIEATGGIDTHPSYYYVVQVPRASVAGCKTAGQCAGYGDRPVKWNWRSATGCSVENGVPSVGCAEGWLLAESLAPL